jgi:hypothetical protein
MDIRKIKNELKKAIREGRAADVLKIVRGGTAREERG